MSKRQQAVRSSERERRNPRNQRRQDPDQNVIQLETRDDVKPINRNPITPQTENQKKYLAAIRTQTITFASGPAGVGKTWLAGAFAAEQLLGRKIEKIIITRPAVEAGEKLGYLPGEIDEKYAPYLAPFRDVLDERLGKSYVDLALKRGKIEAAPFAYMRGRTFKNAIVILDEAQNTTPTQMKMFLTRLGENVTVIVNGDLNQKDIPGASGFDDAIKRLSFITSISHVKFDKDDVVRSGICQEIVTAYEVGPDPVYNAR